jgi:carboxylesterase type B
MSLITQRTMAFLAALSIILPLCTAWQAPHKAPAPTVSVINGTYYGVHSQYYEQDFFLGVPFAQQPVGDLRLQTPQSLNTSWTEERNATEYSPACLGYDQVEGASEACLTLNVVRPSGTDIGDRLPVAGKQHDSKL